MDDPFPNFPAPPIPNLEIRFTADLDGLALRKMLSDEETLPWFPFSEGKELEDAVNLWMGFSKFRLGLTAVIHGHVVGLAVLLPLPYKKMAHQTAFYMVVDPIFRKMGIGTHLLRNLMHLAIQRFRLEFIHAEVYEGSPILPLLQRAGFVCCFRQPDYAAVQGKLLPRWLMQRRLSSADQDPLMRRDG